MSNRGTHGFVKKRKKLGGKSMTLSLKADFDFEKPVLQVKMQTTWISGCIYGI